MNDINILALEGVQGGGKTTIATLLEHHNTAWSPPLISSLDRPRQMQGIDGGAGLSLLTDLLWFTSAVKNASYFKASTPILIDRFIISQWVYGTLRSSYPPLPEVLAKMIRDFTQHLMPVLQNAYLRRTAGEETPPFFNYNGKINLVYIFVLPSLDAILRRREFSGKQYAYSATEELILYRKAIPVLQAECIQVIEDDTTMNLTTLRKRIDATFLSLSS